MIFAILNGSLIIPISLALLLIVVMLVIVFLILSGPMKSSTVLCNEALYRQLSELTTRMRVCRDHGRDDDYILI